MKLMLPGRSARSAAGLMSVKRPASVQVSCRRPRHLDLRRSRGRRTGRPPPVEAEAVLVERAVQIHRHHRQRCGAGAAGEVHLVRQHAAQGESAGRAAHRRLAPRQRPAEIVPVAAQVQTRALVDDGDRAGGGGARAGGAMTRLHARGGQHAVGLAADRTRVELTGLEAGRVHRPLRVKPCASPPAVRCPVMLPKGPALPQARRLKSCTCASALQCQWPVRSRSWPGDVGAERAHGVRRDAEQVQIAARAAVHGPGRLPGRGPVEVHLDIEPERVVGAQLADGGKVRVLARARRPGRTGCSCAAPPRRPTDRALPGGSRCRRSASRCAGAQPLALMISQRGRNVGGPGVEGWCAVSPSRRRCRPSR